MRLAHALWLIALSGCASGEDPILAKCEAEIKTTLKTPSSYRRISNSLPGGMTEIEYEAVDESNKTISHKGLCSMSDNQETWGEARRVR